MSTIVQFPSLTKSASRLGTDGNIRNWLSYFQSIEHKHRRDTQASQILEFPLDVGFEREGETSQGAKQGLFCDMLVKVLIEVMGRMDSDCCAFEGREGEVLAAGVGPFVKRADCGRTRISGGSSRKREQRQQSDTH